MIRHILWDVDGTLFDTYPAITYALSRSLSEMGLAVALNEIDGLVRQSMEHCVATLAARSRLDPGQIRLRFAEAYRAVPPANQPPFPGVREVCRLARERGGCNVIVTHRGVEATRQLLEAHGLAHLFAAIFSAQQGYPRKPDPAMLEAAIRQLGLERAETLLIGDRSLDIQAGRAARVQTCLFGSARLPEPADRQVTHYRLLIDWLRGQAHEGERAG